MRTFKIKMTDTGHFRINLVPEDQLISPKYKWHIMKKPKGKSLTPPIVIKRFIWEAYGMLIPNMTERQFLRSPVTDSERVTYWLNRSKYFNNKKL